MISSLKSGSSRSWMLLELPCREPLQCRTRCPCSSVPWSTREWLKGGLQCPDRIHASIFSDHRSMKIELTGERKSGKFTCRNQTTTLVKPMGQRGNNKGNYKVSWHKQKWKNNKPKIMRCSKSNSKRDIYNEKHYIKNNERSKKNLTWTLRNNKENTTLRKVSRRKEW